jgi:hypothetical protein
MLFLVLLLLLRHLSVDGDDRLKGLLLCISLWTGSGSTSGNVTRCTAATVNTQLACRQR